MKGIESVINSIDKLPSRVKKGLFILAIPFVLATGGLIAYFTPNITDRTNTIIAQSGMPIKFNSSPDWVGTYHGHNIFAAYNKESNAIFYGLLYEGDCLTHDWGVTNTMVVSANPNELELKYPVEREDCINTYNLDGKIEEFNL